MNIITSIDNNVYSFFTELMTGKTTSFMRFASFLGSATALIILAVAGIIALKNKKDAKYIALNLALVFIINKIIKFVVARPRPDVLKLAIEDGYSFPSGHSMVSIGFYGFIIYLIYKKIENPKIKYALISLLSLIILLIGASRVYLGVHYATDVIGGFIIGIIYLVVFSKFYSISSEKSKTIK